MNLKVGSIDTPSLLPCPPWLFYHNIKKGSTHNGKSKNHCQDCGGQLVINPSQILSQTSTGILLIVARGKIQGRLQVK